MTTKGKRTDRPDIEIKVWMLRNELSMLDVAKAYGVGRRFVSQFVRGVKTSNGLAEYMLNLGCPPEYISNGKVATDTTARQVSA